MTRAQRIEFQRRIVLERTVHDEIDGGHLVALSEPAEVAQHLVDYAMRTNDP